MIPTTTQRLGRLFFLLYLILTPTGAIGSLLVAMVGWWNGWRDLESLRMATIYCAAAIAFWTISVLVMSLSPTRPFRLRNSLSVMHAAHRCTKCGCSCVSISSPEVNARNGGRKTSLIVCLYCLTAPVLTSLRAGQTPPNMRGIIGVVVTPTSEDSNGFNFDLNLGGPRTEGRSG